MTNRVTEVFKSLYVIKEDGLNSLQFKPER